MRRVNVNVLEGLSQDLAGSKVVCVFWDPSLVGKGTKSTENPGIIPGNFYLCVLFNTSQGQQLQLKRTSDATSLLRSCCRASVSHNGKGSLDVAFRAPGRSCRCRPFDISYLLFVYLFRSPLPRACRPMPPNLGVKVHPLN